MIKTIVCRFVVNLRSAGSSYSPALHCYSSFIRARFICFLVHTQLQYISQYPIKFKLNCNTKITQNQRISCCRNFVPLPVFCSLFFPLIHVAYNGHLQPFLHFPPTPTVLQRIAQVKPYACGLMTTGDGRFAVCFLRDRLNRGETELFFRKFLVSAILCLFCFFVVSGLLHFFFFLLNV